MSACVGLVQRIEMPYNWKASVTPPAAVDCMWGLKVGVVEQGCVPKLCVAVASVWVGTWANHNGGFSCCRLPKRRSAAKAEGGASHRRAHQHTVPIFPRSVSGFSVSCEGLREDTRKWAICKVIGNLPRFGLGEKSPWLRDLSFKDHQGSSWLIRSYGHISSLFHLCIQNNAALTRKWLSKRRYPSFLRGPVPAARPKEPLRQSA